jgi:protein-tyrosine kinase
MERIKLALEKARQGIDERSGTKLGAGLSRVPAGLLPSEPPPKNPGGPLVISYSQTATVALNDAHLDARHVVAQRKVHPASHAFDVLRTQVLHKMSENGWRTLAITSPSAQSGKTLVAVNLAISISQLTDRTALLVDFDLRRPGVAATLGLHRNLSLNDVLQNACAMPEALVHPGIDRLTVLPTNEPVPNPSEVLASGRIAEIVQELRNRYSERIIVFDLPPILAADDVMAILPRVDCVLLVIGNGVSTEKEIEISMERLKKANLLGVVLNNDRSPSLDAYY